MNIRITNKRQISSVRHALDSTSSLRYWIGDESGSGKGKVTIVEQLDCDACGAAMAGPNPVTVSAAPALMTDVLNSLALTYHQKLDGPLPEHAGFDESSGDLLCDACYNKRCDAEKDGAAPDPEPTPSHAVRTWITIHDDDDDGKQTWQLHARCVSMPSRFPDTLQLTVLTTDPMTTPAHKVLEEHKRAARGLAVALGLAETMTTVSDYSGHEWPYVSDLAVARIHLFT
jgi:hypothetical protein